MREKIFSVISTFLATASIITGLYNIASIKKLQVRHDGDSSLAVRTHTLAFHDSSTNCCTHSNVQDMYFWNAGKFDNNHLYVLAFFLALPTILLLWSVVTFACAITDFAFTAQQPILSIAPEAFIGVMVVLIFVLSCFWLLLEHTTAKASSTINPKQNSEGIHF